MKPTIAQIIAAVAEAFQIRPDDITGPSARFQHAHPRFAVYAIAHDAGYSYPQIGQRIGGRDHSTVIQGTRRAKVIAAANPDFAEMVRRLRKKIQPEASITDRILQKLRASQ